MDGIFRDPLNKPTPDEGHPLHGGQKPRCRSLIAGDVDFKHRQAFARHRRRAIRTPIAEVPKIKI
jgi:hypothetical protein